MSRTKESEKAIAIIQKMVDAGYIKIVYGEVRTVSNVDYPLTMAETAFLSEFFQRGSGK